MIHVASVMTLEIPDDRFQWIDHIFEQIKDENFCFCLVSITILTIGYGLHQQT